MDLSRMVGKGLDQAFAAVKSLSITVTFHVAQTETSFDFDAGVPAEDGPVDVDAQAIVLKTSKKDGQEYMQLLVKSSPLKGLETYNEVTVDDNRWTIGQALVDSGSTLLVDIFRGL